MSDAEQWQLHGNAAELYERHLVPAITSLWAADLVERAAPRAGQRVLDLACGTGIVARIVAERMCEGRVVGVDINPAMLAVAQSLSTDARLKIEWQEGSALALPFSDDSFDLIFCQLGLQFFPDKRMALYEMFPSAGEYVRLQLSATPLSSLLDGMGSELRLATVDRITGDLIASLQLASEKTELRYPQEAYVLLAIK